MAEAERERSRSTSASSFTTTSPIRPYNVIMSPVPASLPVGAQVLAGQQQAETARTWNTRRLGSRLGVDLMAASAAGGAVAPVISMIDRCVPPFLPHASQSPFFGEDPHIPLRREGP